MSPVARVFRIRSAVLAIALNLSLSLAMMPVHASTSSPGTGTGAGSSSGGSSPALDYEQICGDIVSKAKAAQDQGKQTDSTAELTQKLEYCRAAKQSKDAAGKNSMLWKVWAGVAGVCTTACITSFFGSPHQMLCFGANMAGSVTDAVATKNFASSLMGLGMAAGSFALSKGTMKKDPATGKSTGKDFGSCISAATATMQAFSKSRSAAAEKSTMRANLANARAVEVPGANTIPGASSGGQTGTLSIPPLQVGNLGNSPYDHGGANQLASSTGPAGDEKERGACSGVSEGSPATSVLRCALASDSKLPAFVNDPRFAREIAKNTGGDLAQFLKKSRTPEQAIMSASGGAGMNKSGLDTYAALLGAVPGKVDTEVADATYSGGSGADASAPSQQEPDMAALMANVMKQFNPDGQDEAKDPNSGTKDFAAEKTDRQPANAAEDPTISIFERVSYRYRFVGPRLFE